MDARRVAYLEVMGVDIWSLREAADQAGSADVKFAETEVEPVTHLEPPASQSPAAVASVDRQASISTLDLEQSDWPDLQARVAACRACELHSTRTQTVFGVGNPDADLLIIGEAPGADEDRQGEPFVGRAGQLLTAMLQAIGLKRQDVYIANILKCRPPGNRNPSIEEAAACQGFLQRQIALIKPKLILSVGAVSARNLLGTDEAVGRLRRRVHEYGETHIPLLVTYHPAYLLRRPEEKAKAWEDLQRAAELLS